MIKHILLFSFLLSSFLGLAQNKEQGKQRQTKKNHSNTPPLKEKDNKEVNLEKEAVLKEKPTKIAADSTQKIALENTKASTDTFPLIKEQSIVPKTEVNAKVGVNKAVQNPDIKTNTASIPDPKKIELSSCKQVGYTNYYKKSIMYSTIAYSKIAEIGKISIFILSTPWCHSCALLCDKIVKEYGNKNNIDIYYISLGTQNQDSLLSSKAFNYLQEVEGVEGFPKVAICAPTTNLYKEFSYSDLVSDCKKQLLLDTYQKMDTTGGDMNIMDIDFSTCHQKDYTFSFLKETISDLMRSYDVFEKPKVLLEVK